MNITALRAAALREIADAEEVRRHDIKIIEVQHRQVGHTAKYIILGESGIRYHVINGEEVGGDTA